MKICQQAVVHVNTCQHFNGKDFLTILPIGFRKSVIYQAFRFVSLWFHCFIVLLWKKLANSTNLASQPFSYQKRLKTVRMLSLKKNYMHPHSKSHSAMTCLYRPKWVKPAVFLYFASELLLYEKQNHKFFNVVSLREFLVTKRKLFVMYIDYPCFPNKLTLCITKLMCEPQCISITKINTCFSSSSSFDWQKGFQRRNIIVPLTMCSQWMWIAGLQKSFVPRVSRIKRTFRKNSRRSSTLSFEWQKNIDTTVFK